jgi:hypothetical protein
VSTGATHSGQWQVKAEPNSGRVSGTSRVGVGRQLASWSEGGLVLALLRWATLLGCTCCELGYARSWPAGLVQGGKRKQPKPSFIYRNTFLILQTFSKLEMILNSNQI